MTTIRSIANSVRENRWFAGAAVPMATLVRTAAHFVDSEISKKVKMNGGKVRYDGIDLQFPPDVGIAFASNIHWLGTEGFEPLTWRVLRSFLPDASHFIDVGSNIGFYAVLAKLLNPKILVDGFEPVPSIFEKNKAFHRANGLDDTGIKAIALSDRNGEGTLFLPESDSRDEVTTGTVRPDSWQASKTNTKVTVALRTLDSFAMSVPNNPTTLMKIDVEDYEAAVLRGAQETINALRPVIVIEILPRQHHNVETWECIDRFQYQAFAITRDGLFRFSREDFNPSRSFTDFLLLPKERRTSTTANYIPFDDTRSSVDFQ